MKKGFQKGFQFVKHQDLRWCKSWQMSAPEKCRSEMKIECCDECKRSVCIDDYDKRFSEVKYGNAVSV